MLLERVGSLVETEGRLLPGALRALDLASARGPVALASSTPLALIDRCLEHFGLASRFRLDTLGGVRALRQAAPRGLSHAPRRRSASRRRRCLVFEDSDRRGHRRARREHARGRGARRREDRDEVEFLLADLVLDSLEDLQRRRGSTSSSPRGPS